MPQIYRGGSLATSQEDSGHNENEDDPTEYNMKIIDNLPDTTAPTGARPDGALKDVSAPAAGDGTPAREDWQNDVMYALLSVMDTVGVSADDSDEEFEAGVGSQFLDAMRLFVQEWAYPGLDFGLQNISAGNQASDITIYEAGGGSEKEDGFTVRLHWTGGDGTFAHSITSAYTIGNELAGFIASASWQGDGAGELVLRLDKTNSKWLVLTPGVWDSGTFTNAHFEKHIDKSMICDEIDTATVTTSTGSGNVFIGSTEKAFTFPITFNAIPNITPTVQAINGHLWAMAIDAAATTTQVITRLGSPVNTHTGKIGYIAKGFWA